MPAKRSPDDKSLVDRLLEVVADFSDGEAGALVGLSYQTIANYRADAWVRLEHATRRKLRAFLARELTLAEMEAELAILRDADAAAGAEAGDGHGGGAGRNRGGGGGP
jgi:predicted NBD/HSP70 family sugar kinase